MKTSLPSSAARADAPARTLVWDAPVRIFHWLMVLSFAGAWLTAESDRWRLAHMTLGLTMVGLLSFRIVWGLVGTRHARFAAFLRGPVAVLRYLRSLLLGRPEHHTGHNPAGAVAIAGLLLLTAVVAASGWGLDRLGAHWLEDLHEGAANLMLALVAVHLAGVAIGSWLHRENLAAAMVSGRKRAAAGEGIHRPWRGVAAVLLAAVLGFWWLQSGEPPAIGAVAAGESRETHDHDDD